jgi:c-di-GMP-binding flagellar brake protein YcgR
LHLPVTLKTPSEDFQARTSDISAGGVLFHTESEIDVGSTVEFAIEMPAETLGSDQRVLVNCRGRVVRCTADQSGRSVAVAIDEYHFERI